MPSAAFLLNSCSHPSVYSWYSVSCSREVWVQWVARRHLVTWSQTLWVLTLKLIWSSFRLDATVTEKGAKDANSATAAESAESAENVIGTAVRPAVRLSVATVRILLNLEVHSPPSHVSHAVAARSQHRSGRAHSEGLTSLPCDPTSGLSPHATRCTPGHFNSKGKSDFSSSRPSRPSRPSRLDGGPLALGSDVSSPSKRPYAVGRGGIGSGPSFCKFL